MTLYLILHTSWSIAGVIFLLAGRLQPMARWAWLMAMVVCPPLATLLYFLTFRGEHEIKRRSREPHLIGLQRLLQNCFEAPVSGHNLLRVLHNADAAFSSIIRDLQRAHHEIIIEYYIIDNDSLGETIVALLCRRARAGVRVHIIYDRIGSWGISKSMLAQIRQSGVVITPYGPFRFPYLTPMLHRRDHRKMILIDGRVLYLGGINIAKRYLGREKVGFWRDDHLRIEGEAAHNIRRKVCPALPEVRSKRVRGLCPVQVVYSTEDSASKAQEYALIEAIALARHSLRIATPYFLPSESLLDAICMAALRGVSVELITSLRPDVRLMGVAARPYLRRCVECGVELYGYVGGVLHSKTLIVDDRIVVIGSVNLDYRSLYYNLELSAFVYNKAIAKECVQQFERDVEHSKKIAKGDLWAPFIGRLCEGAVSLLVPVL